VNPIARRLTNPSGFTLVELLVVMLIIGVLAALGIASFLHQRAKGEDADAKVAVVTAQKAIAVWKTDHGVYGTATVGDLVRIEPSLRRALNLAVSGDADSFTVSADSRAGADGGGTFTITHDDDGTIVRTCTNAGLGACAERPDAAGNSW
jgi:prepilin-type N-terminal cleavage/methylation domain-containing protein